MIEIIKPDDFHIHLRQDCLLPFTLFHAQNNFGKVLAMPNLNPPLLKTCNVIDYYNQIDTILQTYAQPQDKMNVLMTLYLTNETTKKDIIDAKESGIIYACKLYPKNATTNSSFGVDLDHIDKLDEVFTYMSIYGIILCIHGEISDNETDIFHRENIFVNKILPNILQKFPNLKVILEHITTKNSVEFVKNGPLNLAATITPQHLWYNRNNLLSGGIKPHNYCLPILKKKEDQIILTEAATSGNRKFFAGTDSAPHDKKLKESACGCAGCFTGYKAVELYLEIFDRQNKLINTDFVEKFLSTNGSDFYNLEYNKTKVKYEKIENLTPNQQNINADYASYTESSKIPQTFKVNSDLEIVPFLAGETLTYVKL